VLTPGGLAFEARRLQELQPAGAPTEMAAIPAMASALETANSARSEIQIPRLPAIQMAAQILA
jgi:hypothetical protein